MHATACAHAGTHSTGLIQVKNSMHHFCLWHLLSGTLEWKKNWKNKISDWIVDHLSVTFCYFECCTSMYNFRVRGKL